ncbi:MAG: transcriptional repressor, partial [Candidatus Marinimicrobia bacterium]|nr:transcriptional repressor [Candidatus Neomarinimicrobiota bacterium]
MRYSKQREAILQIVQMNPVHPTADWVYERVKKTVPNISLGTVYRNLNQLVETKAITAIRCDNTIHYDGNT